MTSADETVLAEDVLETRRRAEKRRHLLFLGVAGFVLAMALALEVRPDERVNFRGLTSWPLPHACYSRAILGFPCPGCGLTRSFIYLARAEWQQAWREHRLGWLVASLVAFQFPYRAWALCRGGRSSFSPRLTTTCAVVLMMLLVANWGLQLLQGH